MATAFYDFSLRVARICCNCLRFGLPALSRSRTLSLPHWGLKDIVKKAENYKMKNTHTHTRTTFNRKDHAQ